MNLGGLLLQALLEFWPRTRINPMDEEENEVNHGKDVVDYPSTANSTSKLNQPNLCSDVLGASLCLSMASLDTISCCCQ